jgi:SAM-dependent methyltransferase
MPDLAKRTTLDAAISQVREYGKSVSFGRAADDYGRFRAGYPDELYRRLAAIGIGCPGQRILDLATGTGFLGRGFARAGARVTGVDIDLAMMLAGRRLDRDDGNGLRFVGARAEALPFPASRFDVVCAGQAWHWFDRPRAAAEARRVLVAGGFLLSANFDWLPLPGNVVDATEQLIMKHNPRWHMNGGIGIHPEALVDAALAGFVELETFSFDVIAPYTHEGWRGRIRASAGVGGQLTPDQVAAFDAELAAILRERFPDDPIGVHHRTWATIARAPLSAT